MRWVLDDGSSREGPWEEPLDAKRPANGTSALCPASKLVWAVPTQEGFALQLNSLVSVLALAYHLRRVAVLMPLLATGPHYRAAVATRRMAPTYRMSAFVDLEKSLRGDAFRGVRYVHFDDVAADVPAEARCVSCAGAPPRHVRCARGWDFGWCDRRRVARTRKAKCAVQFGGGRWARECAFCVFSAGFTPGVQRAEPAWKRLRSRLVFAERFEAGAAACARAVLGGARGGAAVDYVAFHMRRGDKSHTLDRHVLTVAAVLDKVAAIATEKLGTPTPGTSVMKRWSSSPSSTASRAARREKTPSSISSPIVSSVHAASGPAAAPRACTSAPPSGSHASGSHSWWWM